MTATKKKTLTFSGFGFPIHLVDPPMVDTPYGKALDLDMAALERHLFQALIKKPSRLSGAELKFMRHHLDMTQEALADSLGVDRSSIAKWEKQDLGPTTMTPAVEFMLRSLAADRLSEGVEFDMLHRGVVRATDVGKPISLKVANG